MTPDLVVLTATEVPSRVAVSQLRVLRNPRHWHIKVWNRGGLAGELCVDAIDGPTVVDRLMPGYLHLLNT